MTLDDIKEAIKSLFNFTVFEETDNEIVFTVISDKKASLDKKQVKQIIQELSLFHSNQDIELYDNKSYEVLIRDENRFMLNRELKQKDPVNKIDYTIEKPTDKYLIFFLYNLFYLQ